MIDPLLAHQGGWDEFLVLLSPVVLFAILRVLERRRRPPVGDGSTTPAGAEAPAPPDDGD